MKMSELQTSSEEHLGEEAANNFFEEILNCIHQTESNWCRFAVPHLAFVMIWIQYGVRSLCSHYTNEAVNTK